eukprot:3156345-Rhodomonas_salina.1
MHWLSRPSLHHMPGTDIAITLRRGTQVTLWGMANDTASGDGRGHGGWRSWEAMQRESNGQAHKTQVVVGADPSWERGFRLKVQERDVECLRVQVCAPTWRVLVMMR